MRVTMRSLAAHPEHGCLVPGQTYDLPEVVAQAFVTGGYAVVAPAAATPAERRETAVIPVPERRTPGTGEPAAEPTPAPVDASTHDLTVDDAVSLIADLDDRDLLQQLRDGELAHPRYDGGRRGVLTAIAHRLEALGASGA